MRKKFTKVSQKIQKSLIKLLGLYPKLSVIIKNLVKHNARPILVGGAVRDLVLHVPTKDLDIEVHGISLEKLQKILEQYGTVSLVGKMYGVLRLHGLDIDWSIPRTDAAGRKPKVVLDPTMSIKQAFARRDLTINAMGIDLATFELVDPFHGLDDLKKGILRAPDATLFIEDPLRFYRVMQFVSRFDRQPDAKLNALCKKMDIHAVAVERIDEEFKKMLLKSKMPSLGLRWIEKIGRMQDVLPELAILVKTKQNPAWHPEGNVFEHSMQALDAAAALEYDDTRQKLIVLYGALCHDLGKAVTTKKHDGVLRSFNHANAGVPIAKKMMKRITREKDIIVDVQKLVKYHLAPFEFVKGHAKLSTYKKLAHQLAPLTLNMLADVALADKRGRNPRKGKPLRKNIPEINAFIKKAQEAGVFEGIEEPLLKGRDLLDIVKPGPELGVWIMKAYELQLKKGIHNKAQLKTLIKKLIKDE